MYKILISVLLTVLSCAALVLTADNVFTMWLLIPYMSTGYIFSLLEGN